MLFCDKLIIILLVRHKKSQNPNAITLDPITTQNKQLHNEFPVLLNRYRHQKHHHLPRRPRR